MQTATPAKTGSLGSQQPARAGALVLVVDDHADTRDMLRYLLETNGCRVAEASDGSEAVRLAESLLPDIILMDTNLPGVDGLTATERIRKLDELRSAKIIFISGRAEPHLRERAFAAGGDEYFVKPIDVNSLQQALLKYV